MGPDKMMSVSDDFDNSAIKLLIRANQLRHANEYLEALDAYQELTQRFGEFAETDQAIAHCYFQLALYGRVDAASTYEVAIEWMQKAISLAPQASFLHSDLGDFYSLGTLEYHLAIREYERALEHDPSNLRALSGGAALYGVPEQVVTRAQAIAWLEKAINLAPWDPVYYIRLGMLYFEASDVRKAKKLFTAALLCPRPLDPRQVDVISRVTTD